MLPTIHNQLPYLDKLNPAQREAVVTVDGPVLVLAGAGTGKTRVLTTRLGHLLTQGYARPGEILSVTFTNKAALEMRKRVASMLNREVEGWWLGTFHSLAARMLRDHAELVGLRRNYTILDDDDQVRLLKQLIEGTNVDPKKWPPRVLLGQIQKWKDRALNPEDVGNAEGSDMAEKKLPQIYAEYQDRLRVLNACDFGDLLLHVITIFKNPANRDLLEGYQNRFKYILVDEYQDTNVAQYLWLRLLAQGHKNICCVGDDDQSIYGWRGAEIGNILKFEQDFPGAKVVRLEQNYRSTQNILNAANGVIAHNRGRLGKTLWSADEPGDKLTVRGVWDGGQEAQSVAEEIERLQRQKVPLDEMAVLVRAGFQTREFEDRFMREAIPYRVIGGLRFYERQEIRDAIAYLRVVVQPDDDLAFQRIINTPKRGLGDATLQTLNKLARAKNISLFSAMCELVQTEEFKPKVRSTLAMLVRDFSRWNQKMQELSHTELAEIILDESGYTAMWQKDKSPEAPGRLDNIKEFVSALEEFETLQAFLEHVALVMEKQESDSTEMVSIMTLHAAKGLEFDVVFLPGWEEGLFPSQRSMDENGMTGLEEERRLAYVGITRARKKSYILFAANRLIYGNWTSCIPSRFIEEIPKDTVEVVTETGLYGSQSRGEGMFGNVRPGGWRGQSSKYEADAIEMVSGHIESAGGYNVDDRVFHQKFGYGTVITVENDKLDVKFDKAGRKKIIDSFVSKAID